MLSRSTGTNASVTPELAREIVRELDVESHEVAGLVDERERQRVRQVADPQHAAGRMVSSGGRVVGGAGDGVRRQRRLDRSLEQLHRRQHRVFRVGRRQRGGKQHARAADDGDDERQR